MKAVGKSLRELDAFTQQRFPDVADRFMEAKRAHQRTEQLLWLGTLVAAFDDDEMAILGYMGYLCPNDEFLLQAASRPVQQWPSADTQEAGRDA